MTPPNVAGWGAAVEQAGPSARATLRIAWLTSLLPFIVCLPLWLLLNRTPPAALAEGDRLTLGCDITGFWQLPASVGERLVLAGSDDKLHVISLEDGRLVEQRLELPLDQLGAGNVSCWNYDWDNDGDDDLVVCHQSSMLELYEDVAEEDGQLVDAEPQPCAVYLQHDGRLRYLGVSHRSTADQTAPEIGPICDRRRAYDGRPSRDDTLLVPQGRSTAGRLLKGIIVDVGDLNGDSSDDILTAATIPGLGQSELRLYQSTGSGYRETWGASCGALIPEGEETASVPLAALADLDDDCRAELLLCQSSPGVVYRYGEPTPGR